MTFDRVERLIGKPNLDKLAQMRVAVVGLGSGGGFVALTLAMSGVGHFILIDNDQIEEANIARHVADRRLLGVPKAEALAILIRERNPRAVTVAHNGRIEDHLAALDGVDLVVCGLDGENAKYILNQACLDRDLTAVYAGVYERGEGGDCVVIHPYDGPCYACWASELREGVSANMAERGAAGAGDLSTGGDFSQDSGFDYGMIGADGTLEAEPGLWLHVVRIASAQADLALNELLRRSPAEADTGTDEAAGVQTNAMSATTNATSATSATTSAYRAMPANTVIMANTALEIVDGQITPPYGAVWVDIARDPGCLVCGDSIRRARRLSLDDGAAEISLDALIAETGMIDDQAVAADQQAQNRHTRETNRP